MVQERLRVGILHLSVLAENRLLNRLKGKAFTPKMGPTLAAIRFNRTDKDLMICLFLSACYKQYKTISSRKMGKEAGPFLTLPGERGIRRRVVPGG